MSDEREELERALKREVASFVVGTRVTCRSTSTRPFASRINYPQVIAVAVVVITISLFVRRARRAWPARGGTAPRSVSGNERA